MTNRSDKYKHITPTKRLWALLEEAYDLPIGSFEKQETKQSLVNETNTFGDLLQHLFFLFTSYAPTFPARLLEKEFFYTSKNLTDTEPNTFIFTSIRTLNEIETIEKASINAQKLSTFYINLTRNNKYYKGADTEILQLLYGNDSTKVNEEFRVINLNSNLQLKVFDFQNNNILIEDLVDNIFSALGLEI